MKTLILSCLCLATLGLTTVLAGFNLPQGTFTITELEAAKKEAQDKKIGLTFIYTDKGTT